MQDESKVSESEASASAAEVTPEQPAAPAKPAEPKPCTKQEYRDPDTGASVTIEHDPNKGLYVETRILGPAKTVTTHHTVPHAWGKLVKISK